MPKRASATADPASGTGEAASDGRATRGEAAELLVVDRLHVALGPDIAVLEYAALFSPKELATAREGLIG